ncbi:uroporphyrinogen decarboxylase family protein [Sporomusa sp.]|uniref:uroporphyrinogen decarboxylase family protein n=1 Tax=Sporomusa sp. TaxID=2078658 RepID=UPI002BFBF53F|nr:uroporphyrinogen decarboxylase family protein [Sporomusa sp.]HWR08692.1 uroporphyrinogen decarboxylase family protein [Sporomusa sp.]
MKTGLELFQERTDRIKKTVALEKTDRPPVVLGVDSFAARHMGFTLAEYLSDMDKASEMMLNCMLDMGENADCSMQTTALAIASGPAFLSKQKLPGRELGENALWQVEEVDLMTVEDYDMIINKGWNAFNKHFLETRIPETLVDLEAVSKANMAQYDVNFRNAGVVPLSGGAIGLPLDLFSCGRGMSNFMKDLFKRPDKVQAAMDAAMPDLLAMAKPCFAGNPLTVMIGAPRSATSLLSPKLWQRFVWPYLKQAVEFIAENGSVAYLHMDGDWNRDLEVFRGLPAKKFIFHSDNSTDIYKLKEALDGHGCIMGDVPPALLTLGTPEEVYNYSRQLINEIGPTGYILAEACFVPFNAKTENVKAMVAAASGT